MPTHCKCFCCWSTPPQRALAALPPSQMACLLAEHPQPRVRAAAPPATVGMQPAHPLPQLPAQMAYGEPLLEHGECRSPSTFNSEDMQHHTSLYSQLFTKRCLWLTSQHCSLMPTLALVRIGPAASFVTSMVPTYLEYRNLSDMSLIGSEQDLSASLTIAGKVSWAIMASGGTRGRLMQADISRLECCP